MSIDELAKSGSVSGRLLPGRVYTTKQLEDKDIRFKESQQGYSVFEGPRHVQNTAETFFKYFNSYLPFLTN